MVKGLLSKQYYFLNNKPDSTQICEAGGIKLSMVKVKELNPGS